MALLPVTKKCIVLVITFHAVLYALYYCFGYQRSTNIGLLPYSSLFTKSRPRKLYQLIPVNSAAAGARFCKTLLSSVVHGYDTILLNWEIQGDGSLMQRHKVIGVYDFIVNNLTAIGDNNDLIFMMDAFDVWLQQSPSALVRRYEEVADGGVVIGADKGCWPNEWHSPECQGVPESPLPNGTFGPGAEGHAQDNNRPRWANSGTVIGSVASMRTLYKELADYFRNNLDFTDQGIFNTYLFHRRISLDYWFRLFWANARDWDSGTVVNIRHPLDGVPPPEDPTIPYHLLPPFVYHKKTGEVPVAIHFNDHSHKGLIEELWGMLWWTKTTEPFFPIVLDRLQTHKITFAHNGSTVMWMDLCRRELSHIFPDVDNDTLENLFA